MPRAGGGFFRGGGGAYSGAIKVPNPFTSRTIAHETSSGQLAMFKPSQIMTSGMKARGVIGRGVGGRVSNPSPPFKGGTVSRPAPKARVKNLARHKELREKAKASVPKPGQAKAYTPPKRYGPNTKSEQQVDDLFGV